MLLRGPFTISPITVTAPAASLAARVAVPVAALIVLVLFLAGGGWAQALLPADASTRVLLSPAVGIAAVVVSTLLWERFGLPLGGWLIVVPGAISAAGGWVLAVARR